MTESTNQQINERITKLIERIDALEAKVKKLEKEPLLPH